MTHATINLESHQGVPAGNIERPRFGLSTLRQPKLSAKRKSLADLATRRRRLGAHAGVAHTSRRGVVALLSGVALRAANSEYVDDARLQPSSVLLWLVHGDDVASQVIVSETEANELLELLDPCRAAYFVVVTIEERRDGEIPAEPRAP